MSEEPVACVAGVVEDFSWREDVEAVDLSEGVEPVGHGDFCAFAGRGLIASRAYAVENTTRDISDPDSLLEGE